MIALHLRVTPVWTYCVCILEIAYRKDIGPFMEVRYIHPPMQATYNPRHAVFYAWFLLLHDVRRLCCPAKEGLTDIFSYIPILSLS